MRFEGHQWQGVLDMLKCRAEVNDAEPRWPEESWTALANAGVLWWHIPVALGGQELDRSTLLHGNEQLAGACLTTCFILSQFEAACRRLRQSPHETIARKLLPDLAKGRLFATVGLSQLTTSRQHGKPAMTAKPDGSDFVFDGVMPWVTGAARADFLVTGATLADNRQVMAVVPGNMEGLRFEPPLDLMALQGSLTGEVRCENVRVKKDWVLAGPVEKVMTVGAAGTGGLETSCLALGLAGAAIEFLKEESGTRPDLQKGWERLRHTHGALQREMYQLVQATGKPEAALALRARANNLVLRATQAALTASKGAGFLKNHPAQRWARQAMFFLVWSCPRPAAEATLDYLTFAPCED